jgi:DNA-directed RNA polymerase specialized sigma subunit
LKECARAIEKGVVSLDEFVNSYDADGMTLTDTIPDERAGAPFKAVDDLASPGPELVKLDEREMYITVKTVLKGISFEEVSAALDISNQRTQKIRKVAFNRIRERIKNDFPEFAGRRGGGLRTRARRIGKEKTLREIIRAQRQIRYGPGRL